MAGFMNTLKKTVRKISESGTVVSEIKKKAAARNKKIVLCEGEDSRVVEAAAECVEEGIAQIVLLGNAEEIAAKNPDVDLTGIEIIEPAASPKLGEYANLLYELRKSKGMTEEQAQEAAKSILFTA